VNGPIMVRDYGATYIATWRGRQASATSSPAAAAQAVARKVLGCHCRVVSGHPAGRPRSGGRRRTYHVAETC